MRRRLWQMVIPLVVLLLAGWLTRTPAVSPTQPLDSSSVTTSTVATSTIAATQNVTSTNALVTKVVDGDTIDARMDGADKSVRIRLLGVNTPETVDPRTTVQCFGKEASAFAHQMLDGQRVRLEADPQADEMDKYNRLLRNIIMADGTDFNAELVKQGYAYAYLSFPLNKNRKTQLKNLQAEAQRNQRGLWNPQTCNGKK